LYKIMYIGCENVSFCRKLRHIPLVRVHVRLWHVCRVSECDSIVLSHVYRVSHV